MITLRDINEACAKVGRTIDGLNAKDSSGGDWIDALHREERIKKYRKREAKLRKMRSTYASDEEDSPLAGSGALSEGEALGLAIVGAAVCRAR